ncbi:MAG: bifunctional nicotinamidase/pyrazinamidase [Candidatus Omnitrophica bacterium]|nr:bifunctional nicotinamidase/pyrazinamidase [Candidatus Omnitrophota bacterium]MCB9721870.1 bifunctional nicotinamidase/pyrazinamidase [Candidatus Omnitrophota bacterium]
MNALLIIDVQNDFCPGGALPVAEGDQIVPLINGLQERFDLVVATQDWHPTGHKSFASSHGKQPGEVIDLNGLEQILWPDHCVQGSEGAKFVDALRLGKIDRIFQKGTDPEIDSYSGFYDNGHRKATGLAAYLKEKKVTTVYVAGLATDYCVKYTCLDAVREGLKTVLITDACRGVNLKEGDVEAAVAELKKAGVIVLPSSEVPERPA